MNLAVDVSSTSPWWLVPWTDWVEVAGFFLTAVGLVLTWRKARDANESASEAKDASQATRSAIERTQRQLRANQMLVLIPQLRWIAVELDAAIASGDRALTRRHLDTWRWQAGHVNGLISSESPTPRKILKALQDSVALSTESSSSLLKGQATERPILDSCEQARDAIGAACNLLNVYVGQSASQAAPMAEVEATND